MTHAAQSSPNLRLGALNNVGFMIRRCRRLPHGTDLSNDGLDLESYRVCIQPQDPRSLRDVAQDKEGTASTNREHMRKYTAVQSVGLVPIVQHGT